MRYLLKRKTRRPRGFPSGVRWGEHIVNVANASPRCPVVTSSLNQSCVIRVKVVSRTQLNSRISNQAGPDPRLSTLDLRLSACTLVPIPKPKPALPLAKYSASSAMACASATSPCWFGGSMIITNRLSARFAATESPSSWIAAKTSHTIRSPNSRAALSAQLPTNGGMRIGSAR